jgi:hypothetical protein
MNLPSEISFIVSQNDKGDNPKRPDYRGEVVIGATTFELAAWKRTKAGTTKQFISGKLTIKKPKENSDPGAYQGQGQAGGSPENAKDGAGIGDRAPKSANPATSGGGDEDVPF